MTTYRYEITQNARGFHVSEADGPSAPATGDYSTLEEAKAAVQAIADNAGIMDLDWDEDEHEGVHYWMSEWDRL